MRVFVLAVSMSLMLPSFGFATESITAESFAQKAETHYAAGRLGEAITAYQEAYRLGGGVAVLYNIAIVYQKKGDRDLAMEYLRRCLAVPGGDPTISQRAGERLEVLNAEKTAEDAQKRAEQDQAKEAEVKRLEAATARAEAAADQLAALKAKELATSKAKAKARAKKKSGLSTLQITGITFASVGLLTGLGGLHFGGEANDAQASFKEAPTVLEKRRLRDDGEAQAFLSDVLWGSAAGLVVTGALLWALGGESDDEPSARIRVSPMAEGQGAILWWGGQL